MSSKTVKAESKTEDAVQSSASVVVEDKSKAEDKSKEKEKEAAPIKQEEPKNLDNGMEVVAVLSNLRIPHQDEKALQLCLMHLKDIGINKIIFNGDIIDFFNRSEINRRPLRIFTDREAAAIRKEIMGRVAPEEEDEEEDENENGEKRSKRKLTPSQIEAIIKKETLERAHRKELEQLFSTMTIFRNAHPDAEIIWVFGCQEHYLTLYFQKYFPHLMDEIENFCRQNRIQIVYNETRNNIYILGQLVIGHWYRGGLNSPSGFVAHALMDEEGVSLIQGHTNRGGWAGRTVEGQKFLSGYENFSLCKRPVGKNWQLGYSIVYREKDRKRFQVFQVPLANYGLFWGDKEYRLDQSKIGNWEKSVVISDLHFPFEDKAVVKLELDFIKEFQPDVIFVNGDVNDFQDISRFTKTPLDVIDEEDLENLHNLILENDQQNIGGKFIKPRLQREIEKIYNFFKKLREICPKAKIFWVFGNHEYRLQRYVEENSPDLAGVRRPGEREEILALASIVKARELGIEVIYSGQIESYLDYGGLLVGHFNKVCNKSAYTARNLLQQKHQSLIQAHTHRMGAHYKTTIDGKVLVALEQGCGCRLDPQYTQNPNWQHGFVVVHKKKNSNRFYMQPIQIIDGAFLFGGKRYGRRGNDQAKDKGEKK